MIFTHSLRRVIIIKNCAYYAQDFIVLLLRLDTVHAVFERERSKVKVTGLLSAKISVHLQ